MAGDYMLPLGIALYIFAALPYFYAPHHHLAFLIQSMLLSPIKGRHAPEANLEP